MLLLRKRLWHSCFPVNFAKFLRAPVTEHIRVTAFVVKLHASLLQIQLSNACPQMFRHTLKSCKSVSDHFGTLCIKGINLASL